MQPIPTVRPFEESPGPIHQLAQDATPLDFFSLFWEPPLFQTLSDETNLYATQRQVQKPDHKWYPTSPQEIRAFIGINMIMGIDRKPALAHYWSTDSFLGNPGIQSVFPRERFKALCRYLHLNDSSEIPGHEVPQYDPLYKLRPVINMCQQNFQDRYTPGRDLSVDEGMIKYKGRVHFRQYMPKKPVKYGIKVWMAADTKTGYVSNYDIYLGKPRGSNRGDIGLASTVVLDITEPFQHYNRHIFLTTFLLPWHSLRSFYDATHMPGVHCAQTNIPTPSRPRRRKVAGSRERKSRLGRCANFRRALCSLPSGTTRGR